MDSDSDSPVAGSLADQNPNWVDLDTDDELEMQYFQALEKEDEEDVSSPSSSNLNSDKVDHFVAMGFPRKMVIKAIKENGKDDDDEILNTLFTYTELHKNGELDLSASELLPHDEDELDELSDGDTTSVQEKRGKNCSSDRDGILSSLVVMGYKLDDALAAVEKCGHNASVEELTDFIFAMETAKTSSTSDLGESSSAHHSQTVKRESYAPVSKKRKTINGGKSSGGPSANSSSIEPLRLPNPMIGFGVPDITLMYVSRDLPADVRGPPYFYYENVALTPKGVWDQISRFLYDIKPEFVDSLHFSAAARKRGYIHNLPIKNRAPLRPIPPKTIHEAFPGTRRWWPTWDTRTKLNCLLTCIGSAQLTDRIRKRLEKYEGDEEPSESDKKFVLTQCKKWNLVWVGKNKVAVLEPEEMEMLMGFPIHHTRGFGRTERYKALGNSFQVDTVAYHLSVLKDMFPSGLNVLSLFSGIGGAEVALHRLGIRLKNVVSVEASPVSRQILQDWWDQTGQTGNLVHIHDVQTLDNHAIDGWLNKLGGFDFVVGGSPCNNLAGGNRRTRDGLQGEHSSLFFQYYRILEHVRAKTRGR